MRSLPWIALALFSWTAPQESETAPDFSLADLSGKMVTLSSLKAGHKAVALIFAGIECPRSIAVEPRLSDLAAKRGDVSFAVINSNWSESVEAIRDHVRRTGFALPVLKDPENKVADLLHVDVQPTAIVLDGESRICYRGLIDDHKAEDLVKHAYLRDAVESVLAGKRPEPRVTQAVGCAIQKVRPGAGPAGDVTYAKQVARILNLRCVTCHRAGQIAPFSLETYEKARAWAYEISNTAQQRIMPPWKPVTNRGDYYNERWLPEEEIDVLKRWNAAGAPLGDPKDAPAPPTFADSWAFGKPDAVLKAEGGFELPAKGRDEYRCYVIQNPFDEDKWVSGIEYRPGNRRAVHHIIGYLDRSGVSEKKDAADPLPGYKSDGSGPGFLPSGSLSGWAPGNQPRLLPDGTARLLRKGERLVLETHYHKTGRPEVDEGAQVALYFARQPVKRQIHVFMIINPLVSIKAGEEDHKMQASWVVPQDVHAFDVMPHMHLIGRRISVVATFPDGSTRDLVVIKDWDFNWQETYQFKEPLALPRGTRVRLEAHYDNSEKNPNNPSNPPRPVRWGEQTTDEMCIAFVAFTNDRQDLTKPKPEGEK